MLSTRVSGSSVQEYQNLKNANNKTVTENSHRDYKINMFN